MTQTQRPSDEATLGALFATASRDLSNLVRDEIELAKAELRDDVKNGVKAGAMLGAAGFLGVVAFGLLSVAAAFALVAMGLHPAWAFAVVAGAYLLLAGGLAMVAKKAIGKVGPPERTIRTSRDTAAFLKSPRSDGSAGPPWTGRVTSVDAQTPRG